MRKLFFICFIGWFSLSVFASGKTYQTGACKTDIRTLRCQYAWNATPSSPSRPYLVLNGYEIDGSDGNNALEFSFDCLSHDPRQYTYTVYHLDMNMQVSELQSFEYVQGFTTQDITDYELSNLTQQEYIHYRFTFPNSEMHLTKSGNYVVHVYENGDPNNAVADFCFQVVEPIVNIQTKVRGNTDIEINGRYQQLDIDLDTRLLDYNNPDEITLLVRQNNRTDNQVLNPRPNYIESQRLRYLNNRQLIFEGGNEYRHFDIYSPYYAGYNVNYVRYGQGEYHAFLERDNIRGITAETENTRSPYISEYDTNGQFVINTEKSDEDDTDAEYMWVHWTLPAETPFWDGSVYVGGDAFNNQMNLHNRMLYDNEHHCYYLNAMIKQGAYDYQYWFLPKGEKHATLLKTEGSHWETENDYTVYVYFRKSGDRSDRLVGYGHFSSISR